MIKEELSGNTEDPIVTLNVLNRIAILNILPTEGKLLEARVVRKLRELIEFSEEEWKALQEIEMGGKALDEKSAPAIDVPIGQAARDIIVKVLRAHEEAGKLNVRNELPLWDLFLP